MSPHGRAAGPPCSRSRCSSLARPGSPAASGRCTLPLGFPVSRRPPIRPAWIAIAGVAGPAGWAVAGAAAAAVLRCRGGGRRHGRPPRNPGGTRQRVDLAAVLGPAGGLSAKPGCRWRLRWPPRPSRSSGPSGARPATGGRASRTRRGPTDAWQHRSRVPGLAAFARAAGRSAATGAALAEVATRRGRAAPRRPRRLRRGAGTACGRPDRRPAGAVLPAGLPRARRRARS